MNALNSILIEGNVVRDATLKETPRGTQVCTFSIASNRYYRQDDEYEQETSFFEVETWAKLAEACGKNCLKGREFGWWAGSNRTAGPVPRERISAR